MPYISKAGALLLSFLFLPLLLINAHDTLPAKTINHNHTVNNNPNISGVAPVFNTNINPTIDVHTSVGMKMGDISILIKQIITTTITQKNYEKLKQTIANLLWQNRYRIAGGALATAYSAMSLLLITDYHHMHNNMFWAQWKAQSSFEDLCAIPQKELARELMLAIGQHHYSEKNPIDLAYPLIEFIKNIEWEISTIKRYITTTTTLKKLHLLPIFPTNEEKLNRAAKMLERALFIRHIFLSWLADYNLTSTEKLNA